MDIKLEEKGGWGSKNNSDEKLGLGLYLTQLKVVEPKTNFGESG